MAPESKGLVLIALMSDPITGNVGIDIKSALDNVIPTCEKFTQEVDTSESFCIEKFWLGLIHIDEIPKTKQAHNFASGNLTQEEYRENIKRIIVRERVYKFIQLQIKLNKVFQELLNLNVERCSDRMTEIESVLEGLIGIYTQE